MRVEAGEEASSTVGQIVGGDPMVSTAFFFEDAADTEDCAGLVVGNGRCV